MPSKHSKSKGSKQKKEKVFHPDSRKADQLARKALRKSKLGKNSSERSKKGDVLADFYGFFYHAIPSDGVLTLEQLHEVLRDVWFTRHDQELEQERTVRRPGRPKSTKEIKLEELKLRETEEYRSGFEVIDLTHKPTVDLFRQWDQKEVAYINLLRFIRVSSTNPGSSIVSRPGKHPSLLDTAFSSGSPEERMEVENTESLPRASSLLKKAPSRFAGSMMTMDGPI